MDTSSITGADDACLWLFEVNRRGHDRTDMGDLLPPGSYRHSCENHGAVE
jgi:hypothetical protein